MSDLSACLLLGLITGAAWVGGIAGLDPHRREKGGTRRLLTTFAIGFAVVPVCQILYAVAPDPSALGSGPVAARYLYHVLLVGPVEEASKFLVFFLIAVKRKPFREPLDGMLHAAAVALSFSLAENVTYGLAYGPGLCALRALLSTPGHLCFASVWGFAYVVLIYSNPRKRTRDYMLLFLAVVPAAFLHGLMNFFLGVIGLFELLIEAGLSAAGIAVFSQLKRMSPYRAFGVCDSAEALRSIDANLAVQGNSRPMNLRAALARAALGDYRRARTHLELCLRAKADDAFCRALYGTILVLQGETEKGEAALESSFKRLRWRETRTVNRLVRHATSGNRPGNAVNEFLLNQWMGRHKEARRDPY